MKKSNFFLILFSALIIVGAGFVAVIKYQEGKQLAVISCSAGQFCGGSATPSSVSAGGAYTVSCNYGYNGNGIMVIPGSGVCNYKTFSGTTAEFNCVAGSVPGTFSNSCALDPGSPYTPKANLINSVTVGCAPGQFCGSSVSPTVVTAGGTYTIGCNYGYNGNGIKPIPGSGTCAYQSFTASNTAEFACTAGATGGVYANSCALDSASPYSPKTNAIAGLTVTPSISSSAVIPTNAISSGNLDGNSLWKGTHDTGTSGTSVGATTYPYTVGGYSDVQEFDVSSYSNYGGQRFSIDFNKDTTTTHLIYDIYVQSPNPSAIGNLELDMNQVTANGETVIFAFQCDSAAGVWDYSKAVGTGTQWIHSTLPCKVSGWTPNTWYHVQISTQRDNNGNVTYNWVAVNGVVSNIGITTYQQLSLGWGIGDLVANFQLDPSQSTGAPMIAYVHDMTIYRW